MKPQTFMRSSLSGLSRLICSIKRLKKKVIAALVLCFLLSNLRKFSSYPRQAEQDAVNLHRSSNITTSSTPINFTHNLHNNNIINNNSASRESSINLSSTLVLIICRSSCDRTLVSTLQQKLAWYTRTRVEVIYTSSGSVINLDDPPIPIIGTGGIHMSRMVYSSEVAMFVSHLSAWRSIFHGGVTWGLVVECEDGMEVDQMVLDLFRKKDDECDVMLHAKRSYRVSWKGADKLLSAATAYTMPLEKFLDVVRKSGRVDVCRMRKRAKKIMKMSCDEDEGDEMRESERFPFYGPGPLYWTYSYL